jgi:CRP/FNR family transcriptional regulator
METMNEMQSSGRDQSGLVGGVFEKLSPDAKKDLAQITTQSNYPAKTVLFSEKEQAQEFFIILQGEIKLSMNSSEGKRLILRIAREGEMLGLASVLSGKSHDTSAEALYPTKVGVIDRRELLCFLARHPEAYQVISEALSQEFSLACEQLRTVALSASVPERLARLLLDWSENRKSSQSGTRFRFSLTHEEVAECIGTSRETVTRTLGIFKTRRLVAFHGATLSIPNKTALESYVGC